MSIQSPTGILDVTNATLRAGKLESTGDITCSSNLVVSGGFDLSAINSNADTVVDFTATRQLRKYPREILTSDSQNGYTITASENTNTSKHRAFNEDTYGTNERWVSQWVSGTGGRYDTTTGLYDGATYDDCLSTSSGTPEGEWLAIQVPEAFVLHSFEIVANSSTNSMDDSIARGQAPRTFKCGRPTTEPRGPKFSRSRTRTHRVACATAALFTRAVSRSRTIGTRSSSRVTGRHTRPHTEQTS